MSTNIRGEMVPVSGGIRAFFAPVDRMAQTPAIFDPSTNFDSEHPCSPWVDLGWVENVKRSATTTLSAVRTGQSGLARVQFRKLAEARLSLDFREWGKLQMALAAGAQHLNILSSDGSVMAASGGHPNPAVPLQPGSTASELMLSAAALAQFTVGDTVAVDVDYEGSTGFAGTGISGACVSSADSVNRDCDYVRRVTFNVARITEVTATSLKLSQPLLGGVPAGSAQVQKVVGFVDREGASFFQEWSALLVMPQSAGGQVRFYYPRLQSASPAMENWQEIGGELQTAALHAEFVALPITDTVDGEQVVCYRSYIPAPNTPVY